MRYEKADNLLQLALELQARRAGMTLQDIMERFDVGRRTAMRMRDAILRNFPQAEELETDERTKRWRLPSGVLNQLVNFSAEELNALEASASLMDEQGREDQAAELKTLSAKVRALMKPEILRRVEPDLEALIEAEGLAMRPGPRPKVEILVLEDLRTAIKCCQKVKIKYKRRTDGKIKQHVLAPYGFLWGHRHYLIAWHEHKKHGDRFLTFALPNIIEVEILDDMFERDESFSLQDFASQSFGLFQEEPFKTVWKFSPAAADTAADYIFHPYQKIEKQSDGSLIVEINASSDIEMAWHLYKWGDQVEVLEPEGLADKISGSKKSWSALP